MTLKPHNLSDDELIRYTNLDMHATEREKVLAERLSLARDYIDSVQEFLVQHNLAEEIIVPIQ